MEGRKPIILLIGGVKVALSGGDIVEIQNSRFGTMIRDLHDTRGVSVLFHGHKFKLVPGTELILSASQSNCPKDAVARRDVVSQLIDNDKWFTLAQFSVTSAFKSSAVLHGVQRLKKSNQTFNKILKTAAALSTVLKNKTPFSEYFLVKKMTYHGTGFEH